jgi:hypothetical protein
MDSARNSAQPGHARYVKSCPGLGVAAAEWLARQDPMLIGSDNWPVEVAPNPDPKLSLPGHQVALVVNGIHLALPPPSSPGRGRDRAVTNAAH